MQLQLLELLRCPVSKNKLEFTRISSFVKTYDSGEVEEIKEGLLISPEGFMFPVIDGIPRMIVEAIYDYAGFLETHMKEFSKARGKLEENFQRYWNFAGKKMIEQKKVLLLSGNF
jgi:uncharacterized protein YbaR (Trm112 family)